MQVVAHRGKSRTHNGSTVLELRVSRASRSSPPARSRRRWFRRVPSRLRRSPESLVTSSSARRAFTPLRRLGGLPVPVPVVPRPGRPFVSLPVRVPFHLRHGLQTQTYRSFESARRDGDAALSDLMTPRSASRARRLEWVHQIRHRSEPRGTTARGASEGHMDLSQPRLRHVEMIASRIACVAASRVARMSWVRRNGDGGRGWAPPREKRAGDLGTAHLALGVGRLRRRRRRFAHGAAPTTGFAGCSRATARVRAAGPRGRRWRGEGTLLEKKTSTTSDE